MAYWFCVHLRNTRYLDAANKHFRDMLNKERIKHGYPAGAEVFSYARRDDGIYYFFAPPAAALYIEFIQFWGGVKIDEPENLEEMTRVA